jgi:hypothetical protein
MSCRGGIPNRKFGPFFVNHDDATLGIFAQIQQPRSTPGLLSRVYMKVLQMHMPHAPCHLAVARRNTTP